MYCKGKCPKGETLPEDIPANPYQTYKNKGWVSWGDWLGTGIAAPKLRKYRLFKEARQFVHALQLGNVAAWRNFCKSGNLPKDIPANPHVSYKNKGWINWNDWLGKK